MTGNYQSSPQSAARQGVVTVEPSETRTIRSVPLVIAGQRITIRTDQSEDYLYTLADTVNQLLDTLRQSSPNSSTPQLMALAALQLANRAFEAEQAAEKSQLKVEKHIERLNGILQALDASSRN
ncbi:MAG: cell division protein ZapA [Proteobacteria bacterium]|nr:cell division protein ZapA [Pseudomonadota bacterium]